MTRTMLGMYAGTWVLLLAGCASSDVMGLLSLKADANERLVDGSLEVVAQSTHDRLARLGLKADVSKKGEAIYIYSTTPKPTEMRFALVLTQEKTGQTTKTRIKLEWLDKGDANMAVEILARMEKVSAP